ncbi:YqzH-like protein [Bacillus oleivorans]|uniref:YqzH-like protein n=1 Tax=Bacillus oleivorans TaxID=1448271 RepID=A0A285CKE2_9BACI|nr:YqzH family protein [Bacillus oleivorans]SNX68032.1 YqzH-like protein [Bacillus oleivorans]
MDKKFIYKMIDDALIPYISGVDGWEIRDEDYEIMYDRIIERKTQANANELYELVEDVVYEYITSDANV